MNAYLAVAIVAALGQQDPKPQQDQPVAQQLPAPQQKPPIWQQGRPPEMADSKLAPFPAKSTVTPPSEIPVDKIVVPKGFKVELWAHGLPGGRAMARGDKGKIYVGSRAAGRVYEITDDGDKRTVRTVVEKLTQPAGVAFHKGSLYVAAIDKFLRYDGIEAKPDVQPVDITDKFNFPPEQHHNWKYIAFGPDQKLYIPFGAPCNICEPPPEYAQIRRYNPDGSKMEVIARGIRNTLGFDWHPKTKELWFSENGRDWMGDAGPEDELNRVSKPGLDYGFPYCHAQGIPDSQFKKDEPCKGVTKPVALLGPHAAALGMIFYTGKSFPGEYKNQIFVARKGSWNKDKLFGFDIAMVKVDANGKNPKVTPFMTGFLDEGANKFWGRPTYLLQMPDGSLLVADEHNGAIYRVSYGKSPSRASNP
jgi:glucose/arabinose dehydrogenase